MKELLYRSILGIATAAALFMLCMTFLVFVTLLTGGTAQLKCL